MTRDPREVLRFVLRLVLGLAVFFGLIALLAAHFHEELEALGESFVQRFGYAGMVFGTFIADGFHFPIPPQFYMLMAVTSARPVVPTLAAICAGSLAGGVVGYAVSRRLSRIPRVAAWLERWTRAAGRLYTRYGYRVVIVASLTPIAYSMMCWLAGLYRMPVRALVILSVLRIPRLFLYYYVVRFGWVL